MALPTKAAIIGSKLKFMRDGTSFTVPSSGTSGAASLAGITDTNWISIGRVLDCSIERKSDKLDIYAPSATAGQYQITRSDRIQFKNEFNLEFESQEVSPIVLEILFGTAALTGASTGFTPLAIPEKRGWLIHDFGDHSDLKIAHVPWYGILSIEGASPVGGTSHFKAKFMFAALSNSLTVGVTGP